jgi:hypothetical protein
VKREAEQDWLALMAAMTYEGRLELLAAAVIGAALGIVTGYVLGKPLLAILIWALIGALVVAGLVYCFRVFAGQKLIGAGTGPSPMRSFQEAAE